MNDVFDWYKHNDHPIDFELGGCKYQILYDSGRQRNAPSWYVQRMQDLRTTVRYYQHPDGAFGSVLWQRAKWE